MDGWVGVAYIKKRTLPSEALNRFLEETLHVHHYMYINVQYERMNRIHDF